MAHVARFVIRHRLLVVGAWIVLTVVGMFSAAKLSSRWFQSFSIPGYSAYEANQRTLKAFGSGEQVPLVVVLTKPGGDITKVAGNDKAIAAVAKAVPNSRVSEAGDACRRDESPHGPGRDLRLARRFDRPRRVHRDVDRSRRRADHPPLRLRHPSGHRAPAGDGGRLDL